MIPAGTQEHVFTLEEGPAVLTCPEGMSKDSTSDLEDWLKLVMRKIKRGAGVSGQGGAGSNNNSEEEDGND